MFRFIPTVVVCLLATPVLAADKDPRDPTRPGKWVARQQVTDVATVLPVLSSVLIGEHRKLAVIDGSLMAEGEQVENLKVWRIEADHVVVSLAGRSRIVLHLDNNGMNKERQ